MYKINHLVSKALCGILLTLLFSTAAFGDTVANQKPRIKVTVKPLSELLISSKSSVPASIVSLNHAVLGAQISGKVNKVKVKTGDIVSKNTLLLEIDCRDYVLAKKQAQAGLESAKAQQALANKQYTRNLQLRKLKTIPQNLLDESILQIQVVRADIAVKKAALNQSQLAIERCKIKAPFAGQITERLVSVGQLLAPNSPVFKLLETHALEVSAALTSSDVVNAKGASGLFFTRGALRIPVAFRSVVNEVSEGSRTQQALLVPKSSKDLVVGYSGRLEWVGKRSMLPAEYIIRRKGQLGVMLLEKNEKTSKVLFHSLPDASEGQPTFINLTGTTQVIVSNRFRLKPDDIVELDIIELDKVKLK